MLVNTLIVWFFALSMFALGNVLSPVGELEERIAAFKTAVRAQLGSYFFFALIVLIPSSGIAILITPWTV
ncbi:hypothetical protein D3C87_1686930 [compost metagenome]|jgi:hypothetical protein